MQAASPFFAKLLTESTNRSGHLSTKQKCLNYAANYYGHNHLKIQLLPIAIEALHDMQKSLCPILIEVEEGEQFYLLTNKNNMIYDPVHDGPIHNSRLAHLTIKNAWQCCPSGLPIFSKLSELLPSVLAFFKRDLIYTFVFGCFVAMITMLTAMVSGYLLSHIHELRYNLLAPSLVLIFASSSILLYLDGIHQKMLNLKLLLFTLPGLWSHLLSLPLKSIHQFTTGDLSQKLFDYEIVMSSLLSTVLSIALHGVALLSLLAYMAYCSISLAIIYLTLCAIVTLIKLYYAPANMRCIKQMLTQQSHLTQFINEMLLQIYKIRSTGSEDKIFRQWLTNLVLAKSHAEQSMLIELLVSMIELWAPIVLALIFYLSLYFFPTQTDATVLLQFIIIAAQFSTLFDKLSSRLFSFMHFLPNLQRMQSILALQPEQYDGSKQSTANIHGELAFTNISLCHDISGQAILNNISMHFPAGKFTAIIGRSGAGKSSLFKLLLGFDTPSSGVISIDEQPIANFNLSDLRKCFGVVLQTTNILPGTIFSNLSANHAITHDDAWRLARLVGLDEEINAMPMKMSTYISDNASESISGGQKQKILIARALAANPKILLLDEATSALDNHSQALIFKNLAELNITRVVIAHRLSTIAQADVIYCLEAGKVKDCGGYTELLNRGIISPQ